MAVSEPAVETWPPDDPRAVRVAAQLHPESYAKVMRDPFNWEIDPSVLDFNLPDWPDWP